MRHPKDHDLALWAGGDLAPEEAARVEAHLAACPGCRTLAEGVQASRDGLAALGAEPVDPAALARIRDGVRRRLQDEDGGAVGWAIARQGAGGEHPSEGRWAQVHPSIRGSARRPRWPWALAAVLAVAALGAGLWYRGPSTGAPEKVARSEPPEPPEIAQEAAPSPPPDTREAAPASPSGSSREETLRPAQPASPAPEAVPQTTDRAAAPPEPATEAPVRTAALPPEPEDPTESMVIQVVSDDPDIVYYWLVEPEETEDEAVPS